MADPNKGVLALFAANASMFRILLHQFVSTGESRAEMAAIQKGIYDGVMADLAQTNIDDSVRDAAEEIVASIFGLSGGGQKN